MNSFFRDLNIDIPIQCDIDLLESRFKLDPYQYFHITFDDENQIWLSEKFTDWLQQFGIHIQRLEIFHTQPNRITGWHIDMNPPQDWIKINWVYEKGVSHMEWGDLNIKSPLISKISTAGTSYVNLATDEVTAICRHSLQGPTLINSGRPHRIDNTKSTDRWCLSAIPWYSDKRCRISWNDAVQIFKEYLE